MSTPEQREAFKKWLASFPVDENTSVGCALLDELEAAETALAHERQMHAADIHVGNLLQSGGARLVERAELADELAAALRSLHPSDSGLHVLTKECRICALLARHGELG